jgi:hypothetical protein
MSCRLQRKTLVLKYRMKRQQGCLWLLINRVVILKVINASCLFELENIGNFLNGISSKIGGFFQCGEND